MSVAAPAVRDLAPGLEECFPAEAVEASYEVTGISGGVPEWLKGTWYVNGPASFERGGMRYRHWLDGDGMVGALRFASEGIHFRSRFIRTRKRRDEIASGRFLYRGFGTSFPGDRLRRNLMLEPPVNVSVYPYAGRLLAFGEQTLPYELDPVTLETAGEYDFDGTLNAVTPFAAHAKIDAGLLNFGIAFSASRPMLNVYEFDDGAHLLRRRRYPLRYQHSVHDFGFTSRHVVFFLSPLIMDFVQFWQGAPVLDSLSWNPELGSRILVAPRGQCGDAAFTIEAGDGYCLHFINCFEAGEQLCVDVLLLDAPVYAEYQPVPDMFATVPPRRPVRYTVDLNTRTLAGVSAMDYSKSADFPAVEPARAGRHDSDFWMLGMSRAGETGRKFFDQLAHGSWNKGGIRDIFQTPSGEYLCGEPCFIANPSNPEEAVVITEHFQPAEHARAVVLFDACAVRRGPIASIPLRYPIHPGFHTSFAADIFPPRGDLQ